MLHVIMYHLWYSWWPQYHMPTDRIIIYEHAKT